MTTGFTTGYGGYTGGGAGAGEGGVTAAGYGAQEFERWTGKPITVAEYIKQGAGAGLPLGAFAWLESLMEFGEWYVPGAGMQTAGEWLAFLSTQQGAGWWESLSPKARSTLQPDYTEAGEPGVMGAAQYGSTRDRPVLSLPWLRGKKESMLPSAEHPYGVPPGAGGGAGTAGERKKYPFLGATTGAGGRSVYRPGREIPPMRVPPARWLLF